LISFVSSVENGVSAIESALLRETRHSRFNARQSKAATHRISRDIRRLAALATEIPTPLNSATYAAIQAGHFGSKTSVALGTIQPTISPRRRNRDAGRGALSWQRVAIWQQERVFTVAPPLRGNMIQRSQKADHTHRGGGTRYRSRFVRVVRGRATGTCPRGHPVRGRTPNRCGI
jgi:hypothetical protein